MAHRTIALATELRELVDRSRITALFAVINTLVYKCTSVAFAAIQAGRKWGKLDKNRKAPQFNVKAPWSH